MEFAGLTIGSVALASLFSTCIECFDYVDLARHYERDFEVLAAKLQIEKIRLWLWGSMVGLSTSRENATQTLILPQVEPFVRENLNIIYRIFLDSEDLSSRYGLTSTSLAGVTDQQKRVEAPSPSSKSRVQALMPASLQDSKRRTDDVGVCGRARWAIHDKAKFTLLIQDLKDMIDGLNAITPNTTCRHKRMVQRELESLCDLESLELIKEATEDDYPELSETASVALERCTIRMPPNEGITAWNDSIDATSMLSLPIRNSRLSDGFKRGHRFTKLLRGTMSKNSKILPSSPCIPVPLPPPLTKTQQKRITLQRALVRAVLDWRFEDAETFVQKGADVNCREDIGHCLLRKGESLLNQVAQCHHKGVQMANFLLGHGANIEIVDNLEATPLITAAKHGDFEMAKFLIEHNAIIEARDIFGRTPLSYAVNPHVSYSSNPSSLTVVLLQQGAAADTQDELGYTPLHHAISSEGEDVKRQIESGGGNWGNVGQNQNEDNNVQILLSAGARIDIRTRTGLTALDIALRYGLKIAVQRCTARGQTIIPKYLDAPLPIVAACTEGDILYCRYLFWKSQHEFHYGSPEYQEDASGFHSVEHALAAATQSMHYDIVRTLTAYDENDENKYWTPSTNVTLDGMTLLHLAIRNDDLKMLDILTEICSSNVFEIRDSSGLTPLLYALKTNKLSAAKKLIYDNNKSQHLEMCDRTVSPIKLVFDTANKQLIDALLLRAKFLDNPNHAMLPEIVAASDDVVDSWYRAIWASPYRKLEFGRVPLHKAAAEGDRLFVEALLRLDHVRKDIMKKDNKGQTAHDIATEAGFVDIARTIQNRMPQFHHTTLDRQRGLLPRLTHSPPRHLI